MNIVTKIYESIKLAKHGLSVASKAMEILDSPEIKKDIEEISKILEKFAGKEKDEKKGGDKPRPL